MDRREYLATGIALVIGSTAGCLGDITGNGADTGIGGLAIPSGFSETSAPSIGGAEIKIYTGSGSGDEIAEQFRQAAIDAGWDVVGEQRAIFGGQYTGTAFEKGDELLLIQTIQTDDSVTVTAIIVPDDADEAIDDEAPEDTGDDRTPPTEDVDGNDIEEIPRYPGSVRTSYGRFEAGGEETTMVSYLVEATTEELFEFYQDELEALGWDEVYTYQYNGSGQLQAWDENTAGIVTIEPHGSFEGYIAIGITYAVYVD